ncbi:Uridine kinase domain-containing protein [Spironucleus salmonicida]|uniref:Uridine kinase domain-containing protein n=1 Tax=Spironucleus salmonicida TaxID=348837 RepID=V6LEJ6_9EUKA|nr:Uridine kinase domain-containing protein [Spironucleus salmonicida]|eukprot:EST42121.1 Uridine kinase domain-containing protein [Spironucleus salmonicida]
MITPEIMIKALKKQMIAKRGNVTFIGIAGGSASGKTTIGQLIRDYFDTKSVSHLSVDLFYKDQTPEIITRYDGKVDYDDPFMLDERELLNTINQLKERKSVNCPIYDYSLSKHVEQYEKIEAADIIIIEGIYSYYWKIIAEVCNLRIFVDCSGEQRLIRRIRRDIAERGRDLDGILSQYEQQVKPAYDKWVVSQKKNANLVIPWDAIDEQANFEAVELLVNHISVLCETRPNSPKKSE